MAVLPTRTAIRPMTRSIMAGVVGTMAGITVTGMVMAKLATKPMVDGATVSPGMPASAGMAVSADMVAEAGMVAVAVATADDA